MARIKGELKHGLTVGKERYTAFELQDHLTAGQIIEAKEQAEKVVAFNDGTRIVPAVVESPAKLGALMLCQQIVCIGPLAGPLDYDMFSKLHQEDLDILNLYADLADGAVSARELSESLTKLGLHASPEVTQRGRHPGPGSESENDGGQAAEEGPGDDGHSGAAPRTP